MTKSIKHKIWFSLFVLFVLFLVELRHFVPSEVSEIDFLFWTIKAGDFTDLEWMFFILAFKLVIITTCLGWYITCSHWWRFAILIPLSVEIFKLFQMLGSSIRFDETNYIDSLPFTLPIMIVLIIITIKDIKYRQNRLLQKQLDAEIDTILSKKLSQQKIYEYERSFIALTESKSSMSVKVYLERLGELKKQLEMQN